MKYLYFFVIIQTSSSAKSKYFLLSPSFSLTFPFFQVIRCLKKFAPRPDYGHGAKGNLQKRKNYTPAKKRISTGTAAEHRTPLKTAMTTTSSLVYFIRIASVVSSLVAAAGAIAV